MLQKTIAIILIPAIFITVFFVFIRMGVIILPLFLTILNLISTFLSFSGWLF
jgi:hypothetical protein